MTLSGGHDDEILAEPTRGVVEAVSDGFGSLTLEGSAVWLDALWGDRAAITMQARGTEYMGGVLGTDGSLLLDATWQRMVGNTTTVQFEGLGWAFRREDMADFNLNSVMGSGRCTWLPVRSLLVSAGARHQRVGFTDRYITPDTTMTGGPGEVIVFPVGTETETDRQTDAVATVSWRRGRAYASLETAYRWAQSNEPLVEYEGPQTVLRLGSRFAASDVVAYLSAARRDFPEPYLLEEGGRHRRDRAFQVGLFADRAVGTRARVFVDGSWLRQDSEIETFTFDQTQVQLGVKISLMKPVSPLRALLDMGPPPAEEGPVVFRYENPKAEHVSLVGDFNGWNPESLPMHDTGKGRWEVAVALEPGVWRYSLVVDGQWVTPPEADQYEDDGFGGRNGVVIIQ